MKIISSSQDFNNIIQKSDNAVIMFSAAWCGPCKMMRPRIVALSKKYSSFQFYYIDVDKLSAHPKVKRIQNVPTFWVIKGGRKVMTTNGPAEKIEGILRG